MSWETRWLGAGAWCAGQEMGHVRHADVSGEPGSAGTLPGGPGGQRLGDRGELVGFLCQIDAATVPRRARHCPALGRNGWKNSQVRLDKELVTRSTRSLMARLELDSFYNEPARFITSQLELLVSHNEPS